MGFCFAYLNGQNQAEQQLSQQDTAALQLIGAMQESIKFNTVAQEQMKNIYNSLGMAIGSTSKPVDTKLIAEQQNKLDTFKKDSNLKAASANQTAQNFNAQIALQINESKKLFSQFLDQYLTQFGQVYEKQGGLMHAYRNMHHIASRNDKEQAITPNTYTLLLETLEQATKNSDWGSTINLELSVNTNGMLSQKNLKLYEIVEAIKRVPLPANYSMTSILLGTAAVAAIATGAYFVIKSYPTAQSNNTIMNDTKENTDQNSTTSPNKIIATSAHNNGNSDDDMTNSEVDESNWPAWKKALFGSKAMSVQYWEGGGDRELYGGNGFSGGEIMEAAAGAVGGGILKTAATGIKAARTAGAGIAGAETAAVGVARKAAKTGGPSTVQTNLGTGLQRPAVKNPLGTKRSYSSSPYPIEANPPTNFVARLGDLVKQGEEKAVESLEKVKSAVSPFVTKAEQNFKSLLPTHNQSAATNTTFFNRSGTKGGASNPITNNTASNTKSEAQQSSIGLFSPNTTHATTNIVHNYAPETVAQTVVKTVGNEPASALFGAAAGLGAKALITTPPTPEKIIVIQKE